MIVTEKNLDHYYLIHHRSVIYKPRIEPGTWWRVTACGVTGAENSSKSNLIIHVLPHRRHTLQVATA